jgi:phospholipid/cholesterol/gamma-HCH transport system substrate-binding protein
MKRAAMETVVGVFVLIGLLCLAYLSIKLGKMELFGGDYYQVQAKFDSVSGLKGGAAVEIAGVEVGRVERIMLDQKSEMAKVYFQIKIGTKLTDDVIASVRTRGIIGDKFVLLSPGGSDKLIPPGGTIRSTESSIDIEEMISHYIQGKI